MRFRVIICASILITHSFKTLLRKKKSINLQTFPILNVSVFRFILINCNLLLEKTVETN